MNQPQASSFKTRRISKKEKVPKRKIDFTTIEDTVKVEEAGEEH